MEIIKEHQEDVFRIGFFDSVDPQNAKLICKTLEQFSNLSEGQTKFVLFFIIERLMFELNAII